MLFDRPAELPTATLRARGWSGVASWLHGTATTHWQWFRPRLVPLLVATVGMLALLASTDYLTNLARQAPSQRATPLPPGGLQIASVRADPEPAPVVIQVDGQPVTLHHLLQLPASASPIRITPLVHPQP